MWWIVERWLLRLKWFCGKMASCHQHQLQTHQHKFNNQDKIWMRFNNLRNYQMFLFLCHHYVTCSCSHSLTVATSRSAFWFELLLHDEHLKLHSAVRLASTSDSLEQVLRSRRCLNWHKPFFIFLPCISSQLDEVHQLILSILWLESIHEGCMWYFAALHPL